MRLGDIDLGIVGYDMFCEIADGDPDLVVVHEALNFGHCHLALGVPMWGKYAGVENIEQLRDMDCWTEETPLRVVTGRGGKGEQGIGGEWRRGAGGPLQSFLCRLVHASFPFAFGPCLSLFCCPCLKLGCTASVLQVLFKHKQF